MKHPESSKLKKVLMSVILNIIIPSWFKERQCKKHVSEQQICTFSQKLNFEN